MDWYCWWGTAVSQALTTDLQNQTIAALVDPFGTNTFRIATKYWTVADKNTSDSGLQRADACGTA